MLINAVSEYYLLKALQPIHHKQLIFTALLVYHIHAREKNGPKSRSQHIVDTINTNALPPFRDKTHCIIGAIKVIETNH